MAARGPKPPEHLSDAAKILWRKLNAEYELGTHHRAMLVAGLEAWDRMNAARETLNREGVTFKDRYGSPRTRPEVAIERDSRLAFVRVVRELGFDIEQEAPRPPAIANRYQE